MGEPMSNAERLLEIINNVDLLITQMKVDGQDTWAALLQMNVEDLMWLYRDLTAYE
jgi:hypothetical protein